MTNNYTARSRPPHNQFNSLCIIFTAPSSPPLNLSLDEVGSSYALLRWSPPPQRDHNGVIQNYVIHRSSSRGEVVNVHTVGPETQLLMSSLQPNTKYSCSVAAVTVSPGPQSTAVNFTTNTSGIHIANCINTTFTYYLMKSHIILRQFLQYKLLHSSCSCCSSRYGAESQCNSSVDPDTERLLAPSAGWSHLP